MNKPCLFKATTDWMLNFLRRNRFVLRRITKLTGRKLKMQMQLKQSSLVLPTWKKLLEALQIKMAFELVTCGQTHFHLSKSCHWSQMIACTKAFFCFIFQN
jgi:hypothetical protein